MATYEIHVTAVDGTTATSTALSVGVLAGLFASELGNYLFVDSTNGSDSNDGLTSSAPLATIQAAVDAASAGTIVIISPGAYDETVTISRTAAHNNLKLVGMGGRGAAYIEPSVEDAAGMLVHADDVTVINLGIASEDETSAASLTVTGSRFRAYGCKIEGGAKQVVVGPGTVAQTDADTRGNGGDELFEDCEFCWGTDGIVLQGTDYGAVTQVLIRNCRFHNLTGKHITEAVGSGGSAAVTFQNVVIDGCVFDNLDAGTAPTAYIDTNASNANTGIVSNCVFPVAKNGGLVTLSTAHVCVGCLFTGGLSTGQPT